MTIYLDHNAGAPMRPAVREALAEFLGSGADGNPSSIHRTGQRARRTLERARTQVAKLAGASPRSIVFTSGGTESNNLAIFGAVGAAAERRRIVTTAIEHSSMLAPLAELETRGYEVIKTMPDCDGLVDPHEIAQAINPQTALVTLGLANAEVGTIQDLVPVRRAARRAGALIHLDAAQAAGRISLRVDDLGCDLMTISAHKIGGPPGIGALYVRPGTALTSVMLGGPQESGLRAGTQNLLGAVGFSVAAEVVRGALDEEANRIAALSRELLEQLYRAIPGLRLNGPRDERPANTLNLTFPDVLGENLLIALDLEGVEVSMGSACAAGAVEPSHVLLAMGRDAAQARSSLRLSLGWSTTAEEIARAGEIIPRVWRRLVETAPSIRATSLPLSELSR